MDTLTMDMPKINNAVNEIKKTEETQIDDKTQKKNKKYKINTLSESVFSNVLLSRKINIPIVNIGKNFRDTIEEKLKNEIEGKCVVEGYIKNNSIKIVTYSSGLVKSNSIVFEVIFECLICFPVEGMILNCVAKNITKAGIKAESSDENPSPFILFISRDHHNNNSYFNSLKEEDIFSARVIGQRYELNDNHIYIIAELIKPKKN